MSDDTKRMDDLDRDPRMLAMDAAREHLKEHFEGIVIICSNCDDGITTTMSVGAGNMNCRVGMAHYFLERERNENLLTLQREKQD